MRTQVGSPDSQPVELTAFLRRNRRVLIACTCVGLVIGLALSVAHPADYVATTAVLAPPFPSYSLPTDDGDLPDDVTADTEGQILLSNEVVARVAGVLGPPWTRARVQSRLTFAVPANTQVMEISFADRSRGTARLGSEAAAEAYLAARGQLLNRRRQRQLNLLNQQIAELGQRLHSLDRQLARKAGEAPDGQHLRRQRRLLARQLTAMEADATSATGETVEPGEVLRLPSGAKDASSNLEVPPVSLATAGLLVGLAIARLLESRRVEPRAPGEGGASPSDWGDGSRHDPLPDAAGGPRSLPSLVSRRP